MPARIVLLRHAEKDGELRLSKAGAERAHWLAVEFLGRGAANTLFAGDDPDAFLAVTLHTIETASPSALSWGVPVTAYAVPTGLSDSEKELVLDARTRSAAKDVMGRAYKGQTVIMVWEHKRIANNKTPQATLRHLLGLEGLGNLVPPVWRDDDFDTIWSITFGKHGKAKTFEAIPQRFAPANTKAKKKKKPAKKHKRRRP